MSSPKIKMSFQCDQDWNSMSVGISGRYCVMCKKNVHDFTNYSYKQIQKLKESDSDLCGRFAAHQIDPTLIPIDELVPKKKIAFASFVLFFGVGANQIQGQELEKPKVELTDSSKSCHSKSDEEIEEDREHEKFLEKRKKRRVVVQEGWGFLSKGRSTYYLHWKYPFIVKQRHLVGKIR